MKRILVFLLLLIFTIQITKSLGIIISFHVNRDYIAENICINRFDKIPTCKGQCFLNAELNKEQKENKTNITVVEKDTVFIVPTYEIVPFTRLTKISSNKVTSLCQASHYTSFLFHIENPPELVYNYM